jgi:hypothetical protein
MHPLTRQVVAEARRRGCVIDPEAHLDAIMALEGAARDTDRGHIQEQIDWLDRPVILGTHRKAELRPLSLAGQLWLAEIEAQGWFADDPLFGTLTIAWALAHGRDLLALQAAGTTEREVRRTVKQWARWIDCPVRAFAPAVRHILLPAREVAAVDPQTVRQAHETAGSGVIGDLLARLVHEFGNSFEYWLSAPLREVEAAMKLLSQDAEAMSKALGKGGAPDPQSPGVKAFRRWREASGRFLRLVCPPQPAHEPETGTEHQQATERPQVQDPPDQQENNNRVHDRLPPVMS